MSNPDRQKWNTKYAGGEHANLQPSSLLVSLADRLPRSGQALDVAGGAGRNAVWLAERGLDVTLVDVSDVAIDRARQLATDRDRKLRASRLDLEQDPLPPGPWDLILVVDFLWRPLFSTFPHALRRGGCLVVIHPTRSNLERNAKPSARYLLDDAELPSLVHGLEVVFYEEGWVAENRHVARLVAIRLP